ncbi:hypothetical protein EV421DRAFT_1846855 [Armillaria borealis]|uniref:Uncharacterized protein n=1 Tax=Armillaria borealis TaxID=47425 RepID=A0AA39J090_9AGAR|nr:hypothetical protein EV421DRAFT_1846855 [Armillaria borealis]
MVKEDKERSKASASSSSESSMDDIRRLWTRTINQSIKGHASLMSAYRLQVLPLPAYCPPTGPLHAIPPLPVKLLALLSRDFLSAVQAILYGDLTMRDVLHTAGSHFYYTASPCTCVAIITDSGISYTPCTCPDGHLHSLTLPSSLPHVLRHHVALCLRYIEFIDTCHSGQANWRRLSFSRGLMT